MTGRNQQNVFALSEDSDHPWHLFIQLVTKDPSVLYHGGESGDFRGLKNGGFLSNPLDSVKTLFDISINTHQIGMGFEADPGKKKATCPSLATFRQRSG